MNTSKVALVANAVLGKVLSIVGYFVGIFSLIMVIASIISLTEEDGMLAVLIVFTIFLALSVLLIMKGARTKRMIKRFKHYVSLISGQQMTSLENIAASTSQTVDYVSNDLKKMINKKFFSNATIDMAAKEIIIGSGATAKPWSNQVQYGAQAEMVYYTCPGCDASGTKPKGLNVECEYCGTTV